MRRARHFWGDENVNNSPLWDGERPASHPENGASDILLQIRSCRICTGLPLGPKPLLQMDPEARILIAGQAPGRKTHEKGIPFDDASGNRLRSWMGVDRATFYDPRKVAILPMGFCFPGTGSGGDLPPRAQCAAQWRGAVLDQLRNVELTLVIGRYALAWHLPDALAKHGGRLTPLVQNWREHWPMALPLPHPSPRNNRWLAKNRWFEEDVLPRLQARVAGLIL